MKPSPRESALGITKDHHLVPSYTPRPTPPPPHHHLPIPRQHHDNITIHWSVLHSLRLKTNDSHESGQLSSAHALLNNLATAGTLEFVSERRKIQDPSHTTATVPGQPPGSHRRINEPGYSMRVARTPRRGMFRTCTSQILLQHTRLCHRLQWGIQGDRNDRNNSPKSTFVVPSAVQIPPLTTYPPTKVSCSTWVKNAEDSNCSQKALGNCAVSTLPLASFVALSDHNDATDAASVRAIPTS